MNQTMRRARTRPGDRDNLGVVAMKKFATLFAWSFALLVAVTIFNVIQYYIFWVPSEDVTFKNGDLKLSGVLLKPAEEGIFPAVIVLHGSGPESLNDPAYKVNANTLVDSGFAVLLYDKRGVGKSGGNFDHALYGDFIGDAIAAVHYLRSRDDIDADRIGLFGTSESGWFTPEIAFRAGNIAFVFNRVGPPLPWMDTVLWEVRNEFLDAGIAEADLDKLLDITERRWRYYQAAGFDRSLAEGPEREAIEAELQILRNTVPLADEVLPEKLRPYDWKFYSGFAVDSLYDPGPYLKEIDIPMYYVFGETDVNVPTVESVAFLEELREEYGKNVSYTVLENVGHPLMHWTGILTAGYVPGYLEIVESWTVEQVR
jgi:pimeloyl-ACP methyl ester carboxylesterase